MYRYVQQTAYQSVGDPCTPASRVTPLHKSLPSSDAELSEDKGMIADKQMLTDLKNITSIVYDGPLKDENAKIRAQQAMSNVLSELIAIAKEQHVEQDMHAADLPQKGKKKRQRHGTEQQGSNAPSSSTMDAAAECSQKKSRGRPQENASVDWAKLMKSGNIKDV